MMAARAQLIVGLLGLLLFAAAAPADEAPGRYTAQLQAECRRLVADGIDKPYGLAWGVAPAAGGAAPRAVVMEPMHSPAAGAVLLWSGQLLKDQSLIDAARRSADAIIAAQAPSGQIAPMAMFAESAEPRPADQPLLDRAATRAGLALLLELADTQMNRDPRLVEAIDKAARWLRKQQHANSALWPRNDPAFEGGAEPCARLDDPELRDGMYAFLLEFQTLQNPDARSAVDRLLNQINALQLREINEFLPGGMLWGSCYKLNGESVSSEAAPRNHADLLASRYVAQALLGVAVCRADRPAALELIETAERINRIKGEDGKWIRFAGMDNPGASWPRGDFGLPPVLVSAKSLKSLGPERYRQLMSQGFGARKQLAACIVGLNDQPFTLDWPVAAGEVQAYVDQRSADWKRIEGAVPEALPERVARLWLLYQRAKLEGMK